jgi:acetyltransferase-like isoleucine patch superfamily enzyme
MTKTRKLFNMIRGIVLRRQTDSAGNPLIFKNNKKTGKENTLAELMALKKQWQKSHKRNYPEMYIEIGDYTYGFPMVKHWPGNSKLTVGKFCSFAQGVTILLGGEHAAEWISTYPFYGMLHAFKDKRETYIKNGERLLLGCDVTIGNDVWVGTGATIMSGTVIGDGCIIGANALVTRNKRLPPYSIWGGVPVKQIGIRFSPETVLQLETIKWWNWPDEDICNAIPLLLSGDSNALVEYYTSNISWNER